MASDIFAKLGDIKGESQDSKHKDEIEVLSCSWGVSKTGSMAHGQEAAKERRPSTISRSSTIDKASPVLMSPARPASISRKRASPAGSRARASTSTSS